jgi:hypothetical protein
VDEKRGFLAAGVFIEFVPLEKNRWPTIRKEAAFWRFNLANSFDGRNFATKRISSFFESGFGESWLHPAILGGFVCLRGERGARDTSGSIR